MVLGRNKRKDELDKIVVALNRFKLISLRADEAHLKMKVERIVGTIDALAAECVAADRARELEWQAAK